MAEKNLENEASTLSSFPGGMAFGMILGAFLGGIAAVDTYHIGNKNGYEEGRTAGIEEGQEQAPKTRIQLIPTSFAGNVKDLHISVEQMKDGRTQIYDLETTQNNANIDEPNYSITHIRESVYIIDANNDIHLQYVDSYGWGADLDGVSHCYGNAHDGQVDYIRNDSFGRSIIFCRERDYDANKALFDEADRILKDVRGQFRL